jgi:hypothetical protein
MTERAEVRLEDRVIVIWREGPRSQTINTLVFRGPNPGIRTYAPGRIDGRAGDVPQLNETQAIRDHLASQFGHERAIAIPVRQAIKLLGWKREEFAE